MATGSVDSRQHAIHDRAAFVEYGGQGDHALLQKGRHRLGPAAAQRFFVVAKSHINGTLRLVAGFEQSFDGFEKGYDLVFDVQGASTPHEAIRDLSTVGRVGPIRQAGGLHRHHVLVSHEQNRRQGGLSAFPGIQQAEFIDQLTLEGGMHPRVQLLQQAVQPQQALAVGSICRAAGVGFAADGRRQVLGDHLHVDRQAFDRFNRLEWPGKSRRAHQQEGQQEQQHHHEDDQDIKWRQQHYASGSERMSGINIVPQVAVYSS